MKRNVKFFMTVTALLLLSAVILTGCMYVIAADNGATKPYDLNVQEENSGSGGIVEDAPISQDSLQAKFEAMYHISEDDKTITVISEDYLNNYWQSAPEEIKSLTTEEVYFIVQDSFRIYEEYDEVMLPDCALYSDLPFIAAKYPLPENHIINTKPNNQSFNLCFTHEDLRSIYVMIMYRLAALSSREAFFSAWEAIAYIGDDPTTYSDMYPETVFYIPGYSETTDREYILSICGGNSDFTDLERFSDLFVVYHRDTPFIGFSSKTNGTTQVFSISGRDNPYSYFYTTTPGGYKYDTNGELIDQLVYGPSFWLYRNKRFVISYHTCLSTCDIGTYIKEGDKLTLVYEGDETYKLVFYYQTGEGYRYAKSESVPWPSAYNYEDGTMFYFVFGDEHTDEAIGSGKPVETPNGEG